MNNYDLERFINKQGIYFKTALEEIQNGKKEPIGCGISSHN